ncbi:GNAT superfamily N-acetyltransferase [Kibdelosporangium banguiense]|uniref:GNAT superfamily N-acetyltransferase n=1 Tax=Kibdelosporangium banguiense TaxID=1365924 RepID=A0ABS4TMN6_9PSEU|nr:GNAT family N-acetyltransferase [Kibdelosporangium banguiense]MBP2325619.1 GNAT superfamily N-acetyltransferase [Kibdelosporangium banguiense]
MEAHIDLRAATAADRRFIEDMAVEAFNWNPDRASLSREKVLSDPQLNKYVIDWPREGDSGVIAVGPGGESIGAAWLRFYTAENPGYGFVSEDVPELSIGVVAGWRGKGVGTALIRAVVATAGRVSLSVERANPARDLYLREGFRSLSSDKDADTMVRD